MIRTFALSTAAALALGLGAVTHASPQKARIVSRHDAHPPRHHHARLHRAGEHHVAREHHLHDSGGRLAAVISRPIVNPAIVVSRGLAEQPVHPHLVEVRVGVTTIYLDPEKEYRRQNENAIDENHTIIRALGLADSMRSQHARIVRNPRHDHAHHAMASAKQTNHHTPTPVNQPQKSAPAKTGDAPGVLAKAE